MFRFKHFSVTDSRCGMKIGTDSVLLGSWADVSRARMVIDLGAGSGLLAMMVAQRNPECSVTAIEIDSGACLDAEDNFRAFPGQREFTVVNTDAASYEPSPSPDFIICNPPYFNSELKSPDARRACARHGAGLQPITAIGLASRWLSADGILAMVTPAQEESEIVFAAEMERLRLRRECRISQIEGKAPTRILWEFSRIDGPFSTQHVSIRDAHGQYTPAYRDLTKDFYLAF